jgi:hypothetical protein
MLLYCFIVTTPEQNNILSERLRKAAADMHELHPDASWHDIQAKKLGDLAAKRAIELGISPYSTWEDINRHTIAKKLASIDNQNPVSS